MNATTHRLTVRGIKVTTRTPRRFAVVSVRPEDFIEGDMVYVAFAEVIKRTDNFTTARQVQQRHGWGRGAFTVIIDLATGDEVEYPWQAAS